MFAYVHHVAMIVPNIAEAMDLFQNKLHLKLLPPLKGEHTTEILKELGYDSSEIQASIAQDSFIT